MNAKMRTFPILASFWLAAAPIGAQTFRYLELHPTVLHYEIRVGTTPIGEAAWIVQASDSGADTGDTLVFKWQMDGLLQQNLEVGLLRTPVLRPLWSRFDSRRGNIRTLAVTRYRQGWAEGYYESLPSRRGKIHFRAAVPDTVVDIAMTRLAITLSPLQVGRGLRLRIFDVRKGRLVRAKGWVSRLVDVEVPAGRFRCYRLELFTGLAQEIDFIEARPPHRLVRQLLPAVDVDIRLLPAR